MSNELPKAKDTAAGFDDLMGKIGEDRRSDLSEFLGIDLVPDTVEEAEKLHNLYGWREQWKAMPSFGNKEKKVFKQINVSFETEEDFYKFAEVIGQNFTPKTKSIYWPFKENNKMSLLRWVDDEYDDGNWGKVTETDDEEGEEQTDAN